MALIRNRGMRFQLIAIVLVVLVVPVLVMLYDLLYASKSDEVVLKEKEKRLGEIVTELSSKLESAAAKEIEEKGAQDTGNKLAAVFTKTAKPLASEYAGVRLGLYLPKTDEMYVEGFLHEYRELSPAEQKRREQRILREVSAGIQAALATRDAISRLGRTWDDEFLEYLRPVMVNGEPVAVVWAEERMHPIFAKSYHFRLITRYTMLIVFCVCILGLMVVVFNVTRHISRIKKGLEALEYDTGFRLAPMPGEMGQIAKAINKMADGLAEKEQLKEQLRRADCLAALGRLVTGIAHELRNPLGILRATVEVMEDDLKECSGIKEYIKRMKQQIERQNKIVDELLDFGKPDNGKLQPLDVNELVQSVLNFSDALLRRLHIDLQLRLADDLPQVIGSQEKLKQVFLNLIINAVQAMPEGGSLIITSQQADEWIRVTFEDTGKGIAADDLPHIFEPYYTTKEGGSGLGLAISQQIIGVHGGQIKAESKPGSGTKMTVYLPVTKGDG
ncbi:MAG: two-component sensor histidine kinase [Peptococcaceae bacterium]|nr:two-component sensor histidine kinase [Peptococcaceae bacterium]